MAASTEITAQVVAFAALGSLTTVQELSTLALSGMPTADPELVAEETLCLVSTVTSRAVEGSGAPSALVHPVSAALIEIPFAYRDYLMGRAILVRGHDPESQGTTSPSTETGDIIGARIERKQAFYEAHLPAGSLPRTALLGTVALLWMGRISPPGQPDTPDGRIERMGAVDILSRHMRLVSTFVIHCSTAGPEKVPE